MTNVQFLMIMGLLFLIASEQKQSLINSIFSVLAVVCSVFVIILTIGEWI